MRLLELLVIVGAADGAAIKQLQRKLDRHAVVFYHCWPFRLDMFEDLADLSLSARLGLHARSGGHSSNARGSS